MRGIVGLDVRVGAWLKETNTKMRLPSPSSSSSPAKPTDVPKSGSEAAAIDPAAAVLTNVRRSMRLSILLTSRGHPAWCCVGTRRPGPDHALGRSCYTPTHRHPL